MTKKFIYIPVVNNFDLLEKAILSVPDGVYDEYFIFNNSNSPILPIDTKQFKVITKDRRYTFCETQNEMREYAIENNYDYFCFMHNDGEIMDDSVKRLIETADDLEHSNKKWSVIFTHYDVFCAYSTRCVKEIGKWGDPQWPSDQQSGYYLDNDYYRRMENTDYLKIQLENTNVLHTTYSNTIRDENEHKLWESQRARVESHYRKKWGL